MKFMLYLLLSFGLMVVNVYHAYYVKQQFYPTILFLVSSKLSVVVAGNLALALSLCVARLVKTLYFGRLRDAEVEVLVEKAKYSVIDTCLALTIFRNDLNGPLFGLFGFLIFMKLLHRLARARLEYLEQITPVPRTASLRMGLLLLSALAVDAGGVYFAAQHVLTKGKSVIILFGFEFGLLFVYALNLAMRFALQLLDAELEHGLASRSLYLMLVDLFCDAIKVVTNVAFFVMVFKHYGLPFHLIRDVWASFHSFQKKFMGFLKYLKLVRNIDARFPDATVEELQLAGDCLVCRERMEHGKKLPCGHVFHLSCLKSWLQHQQSCPLCRSDIPTADASQATPVAVPRAEPAAQQPAPVAEPAPSVAGAQASTQQAVASSTGTHDFSAFSSMGPITSSSFPKFYVVVSDDKLPIVKHPLQESSVRFVEKGVVLFISSRMLGPDGRHWLRAPDGWIAEDRSSSDSASAERALLLPLSKPTPSIALPAKTVTKQPFSDDLSGESSSEESPAIRKRRVSRRNEQPQFTGSQRLEEIRRLQLNLQEMTQTMNRLSESMISCQAAISKLVKDEIEMSAKANIEAVHELEKKIQDEAHQEQNA